VKIWDEIELMERLFANPVFQLRLWVTGSHGAGTSGRLDWYVADQAWKHPHVAHVSRETWTGDLLHVRRGILCAEELISSARDNLSAPDGTIPPSPGEQDYSDMRSKVRGH
jgi:hypothetical protein